MKRTISKWIGIAVMAGAIAFSLVQVGIPVAKADGCPENPFWDCICQLTYSTQSQVGNQTRTTCYYNCLCGGSGGGVDNFLIEKDYSYVE